MTCDAYPSSPSSKKQKTDEKIPKIFCCFKKSSYLCRCKNEKNHDGCLENIYQRHLSDKPKACRQIGINSITPPICKYLRILILCVSALFALSGCENEDEDQPPCPPVGGWTKQWPSLCTSVSVPRLSFWRLACPLRRGSRRHILHHRRRGVARHNDGVHPRLRPLPSSRSRLSRHLSWRNHRRKSANTSYKIRPRRLDHDCRRHLRRLSKWQPLIAEWQEYRDWNIAQPTAAVGSYLV